MKTSEIRAKFLEYFKKNGHECVASSSLVPGNDPTLLFTNAGMVPFKDVFLGKETRNYTRATSSQRCVRAGGKHNDLENVGYTARHHTFFEMLGNFSFGDYFKSEAIQFAWQFLTEELQLPEEKLWVTVFEEDIETKNIWLNDIGVNPKQFSLIGAKDNFWSMGDTGPCGPCSEIFYDHGPEVTGGPPGTPDEDGDRYVEIWNLVFMQYDRKSNGELTSLPKPSVDTGMGLERLAAVMQNVHSNYEIDLFQNLIKAAAKLTNTNDESHNSLRVIADHIRSCAFLIVDGVVPSNEGRGYVLRRIIRRAARHGFELGMKQPFFYKLLNTLCQEMGQAFPELESSRERVSQVLLNEEERFAETLEHGMKLLNEAIDNLTDDVIPGDTVFKLYDTYGFPFDLTMDIALNKGLKIDESGYDAAMELQRKMARSASNFSIDYGNDLEVDANTVFTGYESLSGEAKVLFLFKDNESCQALSNGDSGLIVLDKTPFYAESGGQVGDVGILSNNNVRIKVETTQKQAENVFLHSVRVMSGEVKPGDQIKVEVDETIRKNTEKNHSATHLLHAALRQILGEHVTQKGSLVDAERLRFDFSHHEPLTRDQLQEVEKLVNQEIQLNSPVEANVMEMDKAMESGAMALFGEKYGAEVRVLRMGDFSTELCGGTHVSRTGDIGIFKITSETGVAAGVRRIEAVTGLKAVEYVQSLSNSVNVIASSLKSKPEDALEKLNGLLERNRKLEKEIEQFKSKLASAAGSDLTQSAIDINGVKLVAAKLDTDVKNLRDTMDQLKNKLGKAVIVLSAINGEKVSLIAGVTKDMVKQVKAGELVNMVAEQVGGKGGGRPDMAQAGGNQPQNIEKALASVESWVREKLQ